MSFDNFVSSVKLNNIKTYNNINNTAVNTFQNTFYSDIKKIDYNKYEDIDYNQIDLEKGIEEAKEQADDQPWYKTIYDYTATISCSFSWGVLEVVENIGDGLIMLGSASLANYASVVDSIFGTDYADQIKETTSNMIAYDWTEAGYNFQMKNLGVSEEISQGLAHTIAGGVGTTTGYVALSLIPGGAAVTATTGALSAAGSAAEQAFNCGASYEEALTVSVISGAAGAGAGAALNGIGGAAKGATSLVQVGGYALAGATVSVSEPLINTTAQYYLYANDMVDENGNKLYDNWGDYYVDSGGALNTVIAGVAGGSSVGIQGVKGYNDFKLVKDNINNLGEYGSIETLKNKFNNMSNRQVYETVKASNNSWPIEYYDLITNKNAGEFIVFNGYNSKYNNADWNLDWPEHAGYDVDSIKPLENLITSSPDGKIKVSRVGKDGGHAIGTDWDSSSSQRAIPSSSSSATAGVFDGNKYLSAVDIVSSSDDNLTKVKKLQNLLGIDKKGALGMIEEYNSFESLPEIGGKGGINEVLSNTSKSKYGYAGKAASWTTKSTTLEGGAGQMNSIFSWGSLKKSGIVSGTFEIQV